MTHVKALIAIFAMSEVFLNISNGIFAKLILITQILIFSSAFVFSKASGAFLILGITFLGYGEWVYVIQDSGLNLNLYSFSVGFVSFQTLLVFVFFIRCVVGSKYSLKQSIFFSLFGFVFCLMLLYSLQSCFKSDHLANFLNDIKIYLPILLYWVILKNIHSNELKNLASLCFRLSMVQIYTALIFGASFEYGIGHSYIPISNYGFIVIGLIFTNKLGIPFKERLLYFITLLLFWMQGYVFFNGKQIVLLMCMLLLALSGVVFRKNKKILCLVLILPLISHYFFSALISIDFDPLLQYKVSQLVSFLSFDWPTIAYTQTSVGNLAAEFLTVLNHLYLNPFDIIIGKGFGAGVNDDLNLLNAWVGKGGYPESFLLNDYYPRLHLAIFDFVVKFGLLFTIIASGYIVSFIRKDLILGFLLVYIYFFIFAANKEMMLLGLFFFLLIKQISKTSVNEIYYQYKLSAQESNSELIKV